MNIKGKVVYIDLSGGFWGIEGDNGQQYCPVEALPQRFRKRGLAVEASISPSSAMGIHMWGQNVNIRKINTL